MLVTNTDTRTYDYAIVRVVPRVERGEFVNAGAIVCCASRGFLAARIELDDARLLALDSTVDLDAIKANLATIPLICAGGPAAGPIGAGPGAGPASTHIARVWRHEAVEPT